MRLLLALPAALVLAACGSGRDDSIPPVPEASNASANQLMNEAERAAGNAQARMRAEPETAVTANQQGETK